ncbi:MAG: hypothetical protein QGD96_06140 [Anaerolineae bacterium]|nr:hypothetical protein [Anaerolineae bacterium]
MKRKSILLFVLMFSLALAGCIPTIPKLDNQGPLETIVASTLTAVAGADQPDLGTDTPESAEQTVQNEPPASPRALEVAYIKDGNVTLWTEGGNSIGLTNTGDAVSVRISDDGQVIAYLRNSNNSFPPRHELWAVNTRDPTNARVLIRNAELETLKAASAYPEAISLGIDRFVWQLGTHNIAYSTVPLFEGPGYIPSGDMRLVNSDSLVKTTIFEFGQSGLFTFSPDGTQLALSYPDHISLANADGSNLRPNLLTFPQVGTYSEYQYHPRPIWAADSNSLRVTIPPQNTLAIPTPPTGLWHIPTDGSPAIQLGNISTMAFAWPDNAFSPNLEHIAYANSVGALSDNLRELHIANQDGSGDIVFITGDALQFEGWAPDGLRFVYSINAGAQRGIYLGNITGGVFTISTAPETLTQMRWVDNSRFIFFFKNGVVRELRISDQDGTRHAFIDTIPDSLTSYDFTQ